MSESEPPANQDPKPPQTAGARRGRGLRLLPRVVLFLLLVVASPVVVGVVLLQTPPGRRAVRAFVETTVGEAVAGRLKVGSLDYSLLGGRVAATDVHLAVEGATVDLDEVQAHWTPAGGGRVRLVRPRIVLRDTERPRAVQTATGLSARPWTILETMSRAELVDGRVELQDAKGVAYLVLGRIEASMQEVHGRRPIQLSVRDGALGPPLHRLSPVLAEGRLAVENGQLVVDSVHVDARGATVDLAGSLERLSPNQGTLRLQADADGALAALAAPEAKVTGRIRAQADLVARQALSGSVRLAAPNLTVQGVGPWDVSLRGHLDSAHLVLEWAEAKGYGGRFTASGPLAMADTSRTDLILKAEAVDVAALGRAAVKRAIPLRSRLSGQVRYTLQGWDLSRGRAEGSLTLQPVPAAQPCRRDRLPGIPLAASTKLRAEGHRVSLLDLHVEAHSGRLVGDLAVSPAVGLQGRYRAELPLLALRALYADMGMAPGTPLVGKLTAEGEIGGRVRDPTATLRLSGAGIATEATAQQVTVSLEGRARYGGGRLEVDPLVVRSSRGGRATFTGAVPLTANGGAYDLDGVVTALDLRPVLAIAGIAGRGPLHGRVQVLGPAGTPSVRAVVEARVALAGGLQPIQVSLAASGDAQRLVLQHLDATLAGGRVSGTGSYDAHTGAVQVQAGAQGLHVAELPLLPPSARGLDGVFAGSLTLSGSARAPAGDLRGMLSRTSYLGSPLPALEVAGHSDGRQLRLSASSAKNPDDPQRTVVFLRGTGSLEGEAPLRIEIDAAALPLQAALDAVPAARQQQATVRAEGRLVLEVPLRSPGELRYSGDGLRASGRLHDIDWSTQSFRLQGDRSEATLTDLRLTATGKVPASRQRSEGERAGRVAPSIVPPAGRGPAGGSLAVDGRLAIAKDRRFDLRVQGDLDLALLRVLMPDQFVAGRARLDLRVGGTADTPDLTGQASLEDARGRFGWVRVSSAQGAVRFEGDRATLEGFAARTLAGGVAAAGSFPLRELSGRAPTRLHFELTDLDLSAMQTGGELPGIARGPDEPGFYVSMTGDVEATAPTVAGVHAHGRITRLEQVSPEGGVALPSPAEWTLDGGRFVQSPIRLAGRLGTLEVRAEAQIAGAPVGGSAVVDGPVELRLLNPFLTDAAVAGPARVDVRASWGPMGVRVEGGLSVENARLALEPFAFQATGVSGQVHLLGDRMSVDMKAVAADGRLALTGGMTFGPRLFGTADLRLQADGVPLAYPEGFRARADGTLRLSGDAGGYRIGGDVGLTQAYYTAPFDQRKQSLDRLDWQLAALQGGESLTESLPLAIRVRLDEPLRLRNPQARLDLVGDLSVGGTVAQPVVSGQVTVLEGGQVTIRRAQIRAQQGRVELNGYPAAQPQVDFAGLTSVTGIDMGITARGTLDDLQLRIASPNRPDLSQTDLVSLLLTGRTAQAAAAESGAIVAEELASALGGVLQKGIGESLLVDVGPDRSLLAEGTDPTQRFTIGTRLRQDLMVLYSARLDGTDQRWMLDCNPDLGRLRLRVANETSEGNWIEVTDRFSVNFLGGRAPSRPPKENLQVAALRFDGALPLPEKELQRASGIKPGRRYDALTREMSADRVRDALVKAGWRSATVAATSRTATDHAQSLELVLHVDAGPKVEVTWTGDDPGKKIRAAALAAWPAYASPEAAASVVARAARVDLQTAGYYGAKVTADVDLTGGRATLALDVQRGPQGRGVEVRFDGNQAVSEARLLASLPKPGSKDFFEALDRHSTRITGDARLAYAQLGYLQARVGQPRLVFDPQSGRLQVTIPVRERGPSRVSEVVLPEQVRQAGSGPQLTLRAGTPFDLDKYLADRDTIASWFRSLGWSEARVRGVLQPSGGDVVVRYEATPGPRPRVDQVQVATDGRPSAQLLRSSVALSEGDFITPHALAVSRQQLSELAMFRSVDVRPVAVPGRHDVRDIVVSYTERPDLDVEYGVRYTPSGASSVGGAPATPGNNRLQLAGAVEISDPFGWGWRVRPYTFLMTDRYTWGTSFESSTLFHLRLRTQFLVFDDRDFRSVDVATLADRERGLSLEQTRVLLRDTTSQRWHDRLRLQWGYSYKNISFSPDRLGDLAGLVGATAPGQPLAPLVAGTELTGRRAFLTLAMIGDERDSFTDPHHGTFWTATTELSRTVLGSDVNYQRFYGQLFFYLPLPFDLVWAQGYRAGVVPGTNPLFLLENRFQAGGPNTVRGFDQNQLGPQFEGAGLGGQAVAIFNQELRFPIAKLPAFAGGFPLAGGVFWDAGNTWALSRDFSLGDLRHDVGAGLRIMFPFGPIRLEYAFILNRRPGEGTGRIVFGLGHAF